MTQMLNIGVVGYSSGKFDKRQANLLVELSLSYIIANQPTQFQIVSGLTNIGIPGIAYDFARRHGVKTAGVACSKAENYDCYPVDEKLIVGDDWGDESQTFLEMCDILVRIGGGKQSHEEVEAFRAMKPLATVVELELARDS